MRFVDYRGPNRVRHFDVAVVFGWGVYFNCVPGELQSINNAAKEEWIKSSDTYVFLGGAKKKGTRRHP
jgi:hypothetical protein